MVDALVTRVLLHFEQGRGRTDEEDEVLVSEFIEALRDIPLAGIHAAAERFRNGLTLLPWMRRWRPSPAEFAAEAREGLIPLRAKLVHIRQILDAEVYDPPTEADRAKVQAAASSWLKRAGGPEEGRPAPQAETAPVPAADVAESRAAFAVAAGGGDLSRLMGRLDAKAPRQGAEVGS